MPPGFRGEESAAQGTGPCPPLRGFLRRAPLAQPPPEQIALGGLAWRCWPPSRPPACPPPARQRPALARSAGGNPRPASSPAAAACPLPSPAWPGLAGVVQGWRGAPAPSSPAGCPRRGVAPSEESGAGGRQAGGCGSAEAARSSAAGAG